MLESRILLAHFSLGYYSTAGSTVVTFFEWDTITLWKFQDFSATQILREIIFYVVGLRCSKRTILCGFKDSEIGKFQNSKWIEKKYSTWNSETLNFQSHKNGIFGTSSNFKSPKFWEINFCKASEKAIFVQFHRLRIFNLDIFSLWKLLKLS